MNLLHLSATDRGIAEVLAADAETPGFTLSNTIAQTEARALLDGATVTDAEGTQQPLGAEGILVVAPYNLAVRGIEAVVPDGVRVGSVDRFQGQEAPVVFYAMTCSSGDDVPRGLNFLFDQNRFNVAISRAQCLSVLVYSPHLLEAACPTLESMRLLDGICSYVEHAEPVDPFAQDLGTTTIA